MSEPYLVNLIGQLPEILAAGIVSRTLYTDEQVKVVLFDFAAGQKLSEHTASTPAVIHNLQCETTLTLGGDTRVAGPGTWVHMPARMPHAVAAQTPAAMQLLLLRGDSADAS